MFGRVSHRVHRISSRHKSWLLLHHQCRGFKTATAMPPLRLQPFQTTARWSSCNGAGRMAQPDARAQQHHSTSPFRAAATARSLAWLPGGTGVTRSFSSHLRGPTAAPEPPPLPPARWLADLRSRVGKCIIFGCSAAQVSEAAVVARALATEWRRLTAGSEGYLTGARRGLEGQKVVWGEMDSFVREPRVRSFPGGI